MSNKACALIHGFTGSPKEIEILASYLISKGFIIATPILKGHGEQLRRRELRNATWKDWVESAESTVKEMTEKYEEVYLIGFSMGGLISAYLATKYPIKKLVLLSASVYHLNTKSFVGDFIRKPKTKSQLKRYIYKLKNTPIGATINFRRLVKELVPYISMIDVPTLIIQGEKDDIVDPKSAQYLYDNIKSKEKQIHLLPESKHIVCWDCEKETVVDLVDKFFD